MARAMSDKHAPVTEEHRKLAMELSHEWHDEWLAGCATAKSVRDLADRVADALAKEGERVRQEDCATICQHCAEGLSVQLDKGVWKHCIGGVLEHCYAWAIRALASQQGAKSQP